MNLCSINHLVLFFIMLVIVFIVHKMFYNKKNIETFTNAGWKLNHDGQLCNESLGCHSIGTVTSNNKVCDVSGSNCVTMTINDDDDEDLSVFLDIKQSAIEAAAQAADAVARGEVSTVASHAYDAAAAHLAAETEYFSANNCLKAHLEDTISASLEASVYLFIVVRNTQVDDEQAYIEAKLAASDAAEAASDAAAADSGVTYNPDVLNRLLVNISSIVVTLAGFAATNSGSAPSASDLTSSNFYSTLENDPNFKMVGDKALEYMNYITSNNNYINYDIMVNATNIAAAVAQAYSKCLINEGSGNIQEICGSAAYDACVAAGGSAACDGSGTTTDDVTTTVGGESQSSVPVDCVMDSWGSWSSCVPNTGSCGSDAGSRSRTRSIITEGSNGGSACGPNTDTEHCDLEACPEPVDCEMTWGSWTCEVEGSSCGSGIQTRYGSVSAAATNDGSCGSNIEYGSSCDVDCETPPN